MIEPFTKVFFSGKSRIYFIFFFTKEESNLDITILLNGLWGLRGRLARARCNPGFRREKKKEGLVNLPVNLF